MTLLRSPLLALVFLVVPLVAFGQRFLGLPLPASFDVLLANNALLLLWLGARLVSVYLWRIPWAIRYGPVKFLRVRKTGEVSLGSESVRERLVGAGYVFDRDGSYGEKKDRGFWGALLLHAGLVFVFAFGTYDNLVQLSGTILHGVGQPAPLYEENYYAEFAKGPLAKTEELDIEFQIKKQHLPSVEWPGGATEAALLSKEGDELRRATISPGNPISIGGDMKIHMSGIVFDVWVVVQRDRDNMILYTGWTRLLPLKEKLEEYTYYGAINERSFPKVEGGVWYDPYNAKLKFQAKKEGKEISDVVLGLGREAEKEYEGYRIKFNGIGKWSEMHVARERHKGMLIAGGVIAVLGLLARIAFRQRRVWLEDREGGTFVRSTDREALRILKT
jgi:hypothetical protein